MSPKNSKTMATKVQRQVQSLPSSYMSPMKDSPPPSFLFSGANSSHSQDHGSVIFVCGPYAIRRKLTNSCAGPEEGHTIFQTTQPGRAFFPRCQESRAEYMSKLCERQVKSNFYQSGRRQRHRENNNSLRGYLCIIHRSSTHHDGTANATPAPSIVPSLVRPSSRSRRSL